MQYLFGPGSQNPLPPGLRPHLESETASYRQNMIQGAQNNLWNSYFGSNQQIDSRSLQDHSSSAARNMSPPGLPPHEETQEQGDAELARAVLLHPSYPQLVSAWVDVMRAGCGGEAREIKSLEERRKRLLDDLAAMREDARQRGLLHNANDDLELDTFMSQYVQIVREHVVELSTLYQEADRACREFEQRIQQLMTGSTPAVSSWWPASGISQAGVGDDQGLLRGSTGGPVSEQSLLMETMGSAVGNMGGGGAEFGVEETDDYNPKEILKRKYADKIMQLHDEFQRRRKKGKLPENARNALHEWWVANIVWPYPSEEVKNQLSAATGLNATQVNNWFINQRKRHWHKLFADRQPSTPEEARSMLQQQGLIG